MLLTRHFDVIPNFGFLDGTNHHYKMISELIYVDIKNKTVSSSTKKCVCLSLFWTKIPTHASTQAAKYSWQNETYEYYYEIGTVHWEVYTLQATNKDMSLYLNCRNETKYAFMTMYWHPVWQHCEKYSISIHNTLFVTAFSFMEREFNCSVLSETNRK